CRRLLVGTGGVRPQPLQNLIEPFHHVDWHFAFNTIPEPSGVDRGKSLLDDVDYAITELRLAPLHHAPASSSDPTSEPCDKVLLSSGGQENRNRCAGHAPFVQKKGIDASDRAFAPRQHAKNHRRGIIWRAGLDGPGHVHCRVWRKQHLCRICLVTLAPLRGEVSNVRHPSAGNTDLTVVAPERRPRQPMAGVRDRPCNAFMERSTRVAYLPAVARAVLIKFHVARA